MAAQRALRGLRAALALVVVLAVAPPTPRATAQPSAGSASVAGSIATIRPDAPRGPEETDSAALLAARNETESFQLVVRAGAAAVRGVRVEVTQAPAGRTGTLPLESVRLHRAVSYDVAGVASDSEGALGLVPDALIPQFDTIVGEERSAFPFDVEAGRNQVVWVDVVVPPEQAAGFYDGALRVVGDGIDQRVPIRLEVLDVELPSQPSLRSFIPATLGKICQGHYPTPDGEGLGFDACPTLEERWRLHASYARMAADNRVTLDTVPAPPGNAETVALFRRHFLPLYRGEGADQLPGPHLEGVRVDPAVLISGNCDDACLAAWRARAQEDGFSDQMVFYVCDEPNNNPESWAGCTGELDRAQRLWPEVRTMVTATLADAAQFDAAERLDILAPLVNYLDDRPDNRLRPGAFVGDQRGSYQAWLDADATRELWTYQACFSFGCEASSASRCAYNESPDPYWNGWPSLAIDTPGSQHRASGWVSFAYDTVGEHYFEAVFAYRQVAGDTGDRLLRDAWADQYCRGGHGDGTLFYPGTPDRIGGRTHVPVESIRLKRLRDGREDHELLVLAGERDAAAAQAIARSVTPRTFETTFSQSTLDSARTALADLLVPDRGQPEPDEPDQPEQEVPEGALALTRLAGGDRFATAVAISQATRSQASTVVLARADTFPDALAGSYLAGALEGPILLTGSDALHPAAAAELDRLGARTVLLLGGEVALSPAVAAAAAAGGRQVVRLGGDDRFATARQVAEQPGPAAVGDLPDRGRTALVARGDDFADALAAGPLAARLGMPLLLTGGDRLSPDARGALEALQIRTVVLAGGTAGISEAVADELRAAGLAVERIAGASRFETARALADFAVAELGLAAGHVEIAAAGTFPDALTGGPHAGAETEPSVLLLTGQDEAHPAACEFLTTHAPQLRGGHVLGGTAAVSERVEAGLERCAPNAGTAPPPPGPDGPDGPDEPDATTRPSGLRAFANGPTRVDLSWAPATAATAHRVLRREEAGACPLDAAGYDEVAEVDGDGRSATDEPVAADTRYCYAVTAVVDGAETALDESTVAEVTTPATAPEGIPVATDLDYSGEVQPGEGAAITARFDLPVTLAPDAAVNLIDADGTEASVVCGETATCEADDGDRTAVLRLTGAPAVTTARGDGVLRADGVLAVTSASGIGNGLGGWHVPRSGLPSGERVLGLDDPTNAELGAALLPGDVGYDLAAGRIAIADPDCARIQADDQVLAYDEAGFVLALGSVTSGSGGCRASLQVPEAVRPRAGDRVYVLSRIAGPFTPRATLESTVAAGEPEPQGPPGSPSGVLAAVVQGGGVDVTWQPPDGAASQQVLRLDTGGACPTDPAAYEVVAELDGTASQHRDGAAEPSTRYCYGVTAVVDGATSALGDASLDDLTTPPPDDRPPVSTATSYEGAAAGRVGPGDRITVTFDALVQLEGDAALRVGDPQGDEGLLRCGATATCTVEEGGAVLAVEVVGEPEIAPARGDGAVGSSLVTIIGSSGIGNATGQWNLPASGLPDAVRVFGTSAPSNADLPPAVAGDEVDADAAADEVRVDDADCSAVGDGDTVFVHRAASGAVIGSADATRPGGGACGVTVAIDGDLPAGEALLVLYRNAGPFDVSASAPATVS